MKLIQCPRKNQQQAQENIPCTKFLMYHSSLGRQPSQLAPSQCVSICLYVEELRDNVAGGID